MDAEQATREAYLVFEQSEQGKLVLEDLKRSCNYYNSSFNQNNPDDRLTAFREGRRSVVLDILSALEELERK